MTDLTARETPEPAPPYQFATSDVQTDADIRAWLFAYIDTTAPSETPVTTTMGDLRAIARALTEPERVRLWGATAVLLGLARTYSGGKVTLDADAFDAALEELAR